MEKFINTQFIIKYKNNLGLNSIKLRKKWFILNNFEKEYNSIINLTKFLNKNVSLSERLYCILNNIIESKKCPYCGKPQKYSNFNEGYRRHCGNRKCSYLDKSIYVDKNGLTANDKTSIGLKKKQLSLEDNGNTKAKNSAIKAVTKIRKEKGKTFFKERSKLSAETKYKTISSNGLNIHQIGARKASETMNQLLSNGNTIKEERLAKMYETKSKIGEDGLDCFERGFLNGAGKNSSIKYYNKDLYYQGTYERDFLDHLKNLKYIDKVERGERFDYFFNNKKRQYRSDFKIGNIIFEIKSNWTYGKNDDIKRLKNHTKFKSVLDNGYRLIIILDKNYYIELTNANINNNLFMEKLNNINNLKSIIE